MNAQYWTLRILVGLLLFIGAITGLGMPIAFLTPTAIASEEIGTYASPDDDDEDYDDEDYDDEDYDDE